MQWCYRPIHATSSQSKRDICSTCYWTKQPDREQNTVRHPICDWDRKLRCCLCWLCSPTYHTLLLLHIPSTSPCTSRKNISDFHAFPKLLIFRVGRTRTGKKQEEPIMTRKRAVLVFGCGIKRAVWEKRWETTKQEAEVEEEAVVKFPEVK